MTDITLTKKNESYIYIDCEIGILYELAEHFTFYVDGYKHMPKYKTGQWSGKICLIDLRFGNLPLGLTTELLEIACKLGYEVEIKDSQYGVPNEQCNASYEEVKNFILELKISRFNNDLQSSELISVRDYQILSIFNCIKNQRQLLISPTGSGKSLIAYCLYRWFLSKGADHIMLVVPNLGLIKQMHSDFKEYSLINGFDVDANVQIIADGGSKNVTKSFLLSTWQSVYKQTSPWWKSIDVIIGDECHQYKAEACRNIFERATETKYKFGLTGSLDKSNVNKLTLRGLIGDISKVKSTRDLIEEGHLSDIDIKCIILKYNDDTKKLTKKFDYQKEIDFLCQHKKRNKFIRNLALSLKGNTLILFGRVETHGEPLYESIKEKATSHQVHFVSGKVSADDRERIRKLVQESNESNIIVGSFGTLSTGVNIPRLHNIIFATPSKSVIRVMQSIGRGLRKADDKTHLMLYDISDCINPSKSRPNFTMKHFVERLRIYTDESHPYQILEIDIE